MTRLLSRTAALVVARCLAATFLVGCGDDDYGHERPPVDQSAVVVVDMRKPPDLTDLLINCDGANPGDGICGPADAGPPDASIDLRN